MTGRRIVACALLGLVALAGPAFGQSAGGVGKGDNAKQALRARYVQAIQSAIRANWLSPADLPQAACKVRITQAPGGAVEEVVVDPACPYGELGRKSVIAAVKRAQPLPYKGFESVFRRTLIFTFMPNPMEGANRAPH